MGSDTIFVLHPPNPAHSACSLHVSTSSNSSIACRTGNSAALYHFYVWRIRCTFKWLDRPGGERKSFNWATWVQAL
jgi:hypothetical protein